MGCWRKGGSEGIGSLGSVRDWWRARTCSLTSITLSLDFGPTGRSRATFILNSSQVHSAILPSVSASNNQQRIYSSARRTPFVSHRRCRLAFSRQPTIRKLS
ncbi:hypothetical protein VTK26DRAFT_3664 [Humicola hyalothermophila]